MNHLIKFKKVISVLAIVLIPIIIIEYIPYFNETKLLAHSMLSGKNYDEAKIDLGFLYLRGDGVTQDTKKAIDLFQESAEKGYVPAQIILGGLYYSDKEVKDYNQAFKWYKLAADNGDASAKSIIENWQESIKALQ